MCLKFLCKLENGALNISVSSISAKSVSLSWTQPNFSLPVQYMVTVTPLHESSQVLCADNVIIDSVPINSTVMDYLTANITGLQEFSSYAATVVVRQNGFLLNTLTLGSVQFTTLSAGM